MLEIVERANKIDNLNFWVLFVSSLFNKKTQKHKYIQKENEKMEDLYFTTE